LLPALLYAGRVAGRRSRISLDNRRGFYKREKEIPLNHKLNIAIQVSRM
jgi:hypothetical protein